MKRQIVERLETVEADADAVEIEDADWRRLSMLLLRGFRLGRDGIGVRCRVRVSAILNNPGNALRAGTG